VHVGKRSKEKRKKEEKIYAFDQKSVALGHACGKMFWIFNITPA
jgi:ribosomal protein L30E